MAKAKLDSSEPDEAPFRAAADASSDSHFVLVPTRNQDGEISDFLCEYLNQAAAQRLGNESGKFVGRCLAGACPTREVLALIDLCARHIEGGRQTDEQVLEGPPSNPATRWSVVQMTTLQVGVYVVLRDLSPWVRETETHKSIAKFWDSLIDHIPAAIFVKDSRLLRFQHVNRAAENLLGIPRGRLLGKTDHEIFPSEQAEGFRKRDRAAQDSGALVATPEERIQTIEGERWIQTMTIPIPNNEGSSDFLVGISIDITERKQAEAALRLHGVIMDAMSDGICLLREDDETVVQSNPKFDDMLGFERDGLIGNTLDWSDRKITERSEKKSDPGPLRLCEKLGNATEGHFETKTLRRDGTPIWCRVHACKLEHPKFGMIWVTVHEDITERIQMQAKLVFNGRMASVGTLAAGVAHEINNPLSYVIANLEMIIEEIRLLSSEGTDAQVEDIFQMATGAKDGARRVREIVRSLRTFSRVDEERRAVIDVRPVVDLSISMAFHEIRHKARLVKDYAEVPLVEADDARLGQVFINLLVNAAQALQTGSPDDNEIRVSTFTDSHGRAVIEVADTGAGIPPATLGRIFDPFFTTKPVGTGTGIGLSICHNIVASLNGEITVDTTVGQGTTFRVIIPPAEALHDAPHADTPVATEAYRMGSVLVVDDEPAVGLTLARVLRRHEVTVVTRAQEALDLLAAGRKFDVILSDIMMPEMSGTELYEQLEQRFPDAAKRVIFVTGGAFTPFAGAFLDRVPNQYIAKPFEADQVRQMVNKFVPHRLH